MEPNTPRAEAERWLGISAKLLAARDLVGSRSFAIRARESDPTNPISDQILAVVDTLIAAEKRVINSSHHDWYSILHLSHLVRDPDLIASQYRRLVLLLNPEHNHLPFSDFAFRLVVDAWSVLSDPTKKWIYDSELSIFLQRACAAPDPDPVRVDSAAAATYQFFQQPPQQTQAQQQQQQQQQWIHHLQEQQQQQQQQPPQLQEQQLFQQQHRPQPTPPPPQQQQQQQQWLQQTQQLQQLLPEQHQHQQRSSSQQSQPQWLPQPPQSQPPPPPPLQWMPEQQHQQRPPQQQQQQQPKEQQQITPQLQRQPPPPQPKEAKITIPQLQRKPPPPPKEPQIPPQLQRQPPPQPKEPQIPPQLQRQPPQQQQKSKQTMQQQRTPPAPAPVVQAMPTQWPPQQPERERNNEDGIGRVSNVTTERGNERQQLKMQQQRTTPPSPAPAPVVQAMPTQWPPQQQPERERNGEEDRIGRVSNVTTENGNKKNAFNDSAKINDNHVVDDGEKIEGFWTACPYCYHLFEYAKTFQDCTLRCQICRRAFHAQKIPNPPGTEGKGGEEANFCSWSVFPIGFSMAGWKKSMPFGGEGNGVRSNWVPFSPLFACPVQQKEVKKKAWRTVDEDDEDFHVSDPSDDDWDSSDDWGSAKRAKTQGNARGGGRGGSRRGGRKSNAEREKMGNQQSVGADGVNHVVSGIKNDLINKAVASGGLKKQTGKGVRGRKKLDLNVEFSNEVEDHAPVMRESRDGTGGEEVVGFFEGLDEFLSTLPILHPVGDDKAKASQ